MQQEILKTVKWDSTQSLFAVYSVKFMAKVLFCLLRKSLQN